MSNVWCLIHPSEPTNEHDRLIHVARARGYIPSKGNLLLLDKLDTSPCAPGDLVLVSNLAAWRVQPATVAEFVRDALVQGIRVLEMQSELSLTDNLPMVQLMCNAMKHWPGLVREQKDENARLAARHAQAEDELIVLATREVTKRLMGIDVEALKQIANAGASP